MGLKINKALGYGTDKLVMKAGELNDPRFDAKGFLGESKQTGLSEKMFKFYEGQILKAFVNEFVDENKADRLFEYAKKEAIGLDSKSRQTNRGTTRATEMKMCFEFEYSDIPAVVFIPPNVTGWHRYDDVIDYHEHGLVPGGSFRYINVSHVFPLVGDMHRYRGQARFDWEPKNISGGHYNHLTGLFVPEDPKPLLEGDDLQDMLENWRPTLPWLLLAWIQVQDWIKDKKGFADMLRPCIYVYWS